MKIVEKNMIYQIYQIKRIIGDNNIEKFNPEGIYALQFTEKKENIIKDM